MTSIRTVIWLFLDQLYLWLNTSNWNAANMKLNKKEASFYSRVHMIFVQNQKFSLLQLIAFKSCSFYSIFPIMFLTLNVSGIPKCSFTFSFDLFPIHILTTFSHLCLLPTTFPKSTQVYAYEYYGMESNKFPCGRSMCNSYLCEAAYGFCYQGLIGNNLFVLVRLRFAYS